MPTLPQVRAEVRVALREMDARKPIGLVEVDQAIRKCYLLLQFRLPAARSYTASAFTISSAAETFTLPTTSSAEYAGDVRIQLASDGSFLTKLTIEEIDAYRDGQSSTAVGVPRYFALYEEDDGEVQGRCYPRANQAYVCNLFRSLVAADFDLTALDSTNIRLSRPAATALVLKSACYLVAGMTAEDLATRRLDRGIVSLWNDEAERAIYQEAMRRHAIGATGRYKRNVA